MKRLFLTLSISLVVLPLSFVLGQQPPQPPPSKGIVSGTVVKATTGEPIPRVQVTLARVASAQNSATVETVTVPVAGTRGNAAPPAQQQIQQAQQPVILPTVMSDDQGVFTIKDVPVGSYRVVAVRNGFSRQEFGQRSTGRPGSVINVRGGQTVADIAFRLTPAGTITGRVIDANGEPLPGVSVQALRSTYDATGKRSLQPAAAAKTNDLGEYRLYWINPGRYFLNANPAPSGLEALTAISSQAAAAAPPSTPEEAQMMAQSQSILGPGKNLNEAANSGFVVSYYPNTPDPARAASVELQPGAEIHGIDFLLTKDQKVRIRGKIVDAGTGKPPQMAQVSVTPRNASGGSPLDLLMGLGGALQGNTYDSTTGEFEVREVSSGSYNLQVMSQAQLPQPTAGARGASPADAADALSALASINTTQVPVEVRGLDIDNVSITVAPGVTVPGRIHMDAGPITGNQNQSQNPFDRFTVALQSSTGGINIFAILGGGNGGKPAADGTFSLPRTAPGDYKVSVSGMAPNMYIKEARLDQMDVLGGIAIGDRVNGTLDITMSPNAGQLDGNITDGLSKPVTGVQAVLIPERDRERHELYKTGVTDPSGHFTMRGIPPGNYKLFAWEDIEAFSYFDPDVLRQYESQGKVVLIRESSKEAVDMKIIPAAAP